MDVIYQKFIDSLIETEKHLQSADHIIFVTIPVVKDPKLMLRAFESVYRGLTLNISTILKFEYLYKRITLSNDTKINLETFFARCSKNYGLNEGECKLLKEIIFLGKKHKESGLEFSRSGKVIMVDDELGVFEIGIIKLKEFFSISKKLLQSTNKNFMDKI